MPRLRLIALVLPLLLAGCSSASVDPDVASSTATAPRTVASMLPRLSRSLTPAGAEAIFGKPDQTTGSGLIIYVYKVEEGKSIYLGFPGYAPITYAKLIDANGAGLELPLVD